MEWYTVGRLVATAAVEWLAVGRLVAAVVAAATYPFVAVPDCAACEAQNRKSN